MPESPAHPTARGVRELSRQELGELVDEFVQRAFLPTHHEERARPLRNLLEQYDLRPVSALQLMRKWVDADPWDFWMAVVAALRDQPENKATPGLLELVASEDVLLDTVCDPALYSLEVALELSGRLGRVEPMLEVRQLSRLVNRAPSGDGAAHAYRIRRALQIVGRGARNDRLAPLLMKLLRHADGKIRSKATLLLAREFRNLDWVAQQLTDPEPRVRANAAEGLWHAEDSPEKSSLLWQAVEDGQARVAINALVGLCRMGDGKAPRRLEELAAHACHRFRASAAWGMGELADVQFSDCLKRLARDEDSGVRRNAIRSLVRLRGRQAAAEAGGQ